MRAEVKEKFQKKTKDSGGETIAETLASLLIIVLAMTMLAGSIVSASKVNRQVQDNNNAFVTSVTDSAEDGKVVIAHGTGGNTEVPAKITTTKDGYVFYEKAD